jgi:hypothetical protein
MGITWAASADKHGVPHEDALHAMLNAYLRVPDFNEPRIPAAGRPTLYIGPPRQLGAPLIEVLAEEVPPRDLSIFHVMPARQKYVDLLKERGVL